MTPHALLLWTTYEGREGWFLRDSVVSYKPLLPVEGPSEDASDRELYESLKRPENKEALYTARMRGRALIERRYIDPTLPCKKCGKPVGEDAVRSLEHLRKLRGEDRAAQPKVCLPCLWNTLSSMADEDENDEQPS